MRYTVEDRAIVWLCACTELGYLERVAALRAAKDPARLFGLAGELVPSAAKQCSGSAASREREADAFLETLERKGYFAVTLAGEGYPEALKQIPDPPLVLFGAGNASLLSARKFCIVGSRITPPWAEALGRRISEALAERFAVVTGLAEGGDGAAIAGALPSGNLISVLPCGLDCCYPASHAGLKKQIRERGLLLSEYLPGEPAAKYSFHARNRILAGLSEGVLVLSAAERSGALITAGRALDYGRDVFAVPYNPNVAQGAGCDLLIKRGAALTTGAEDILEWYGLDAPPAEEEKAEPLSPEEARVLRLLRESGEMHVAEIARRAELGFPETAAVLSALELAGEAVKAGGNRYAAVKNKNRSASHRAR